MACKLLWFVMLCCSFNVVAEVKFSGFGTLGIIYSDSKHYGYRKDIGSDQAVFAGDYDFTSNTLLGLQMDARLANSLDFVVQAVARDRVKSNLDRAITLGFLRYNASPNWSFRLGRTAIDLFYLTDSRDIDFSYHWATAPAEMYGLIPYRSIDGFDITYTTRFYDGTFSSKLFTGVSDAEISASGTNQTISLNNIVGVSLTYDHFNWLVQAKHTRVNIANEAESSQFVIDQIAQLPDFIWPNAGAFSQRIALKDRNANYSSVSAQYTWQPWQFTTEVSHTSSKADAIPDVTSGYAAISFQYHQHTFYSLYALTQSSNYQFNEPNVQVSYIPELVYAVDGMMNFYASNQQTVAVGWRWDLKSNLSMTLQFNNTHIENNGGTLWNNAGFDLSAESVNTTLLNLSVVF
jgi:hypothetical protein